MYRKFNKLKLRNPDLKTIIAIGGWNEGSEKYSNMSRTAEGRTRFVGSVVEFLDRHGFDGLDLNWEYPVRRGGSPEDRDNHALLVRELRAALDQKERLLIASVSMGIPTVNVSYDVPEIMEMKILLGSVLFPSSLTVWMTMGPLHEKAPTRKGAPPLTAQWETICLMVRSGGWKEYRDPDVDAPIIVKGDQWISYDDKRSLTAKVSFYKAGGESLPERNRLSN
ncbi:unnamed protein product [Ixodes hexagonus]